MEDTADSKLKTQLREQSEDSQVVWDIEKSYGPYTEASAFGLLHLGRKRAKQNLYAWASEVAKRFHEESRRHARGDGVPKEFGGYGIRVQERFWSVTIQWVFIEGRGKGRSVKREPLRAPTAGQYRMTNSRFPKAKDWELEAIAAAEDEFEKIRRCCEHLKTMTGAAQGFERIMRARTSVSE